MLNFVIAAVLSVSAVDVNVELLAGSGASGSLMELSADNLVVQTADGPQTFELKSLLAITPTVKPIAPTTTAKVTVELVDGSRLLATSFVVTDGKALVGLLGGGEVEIRTRSIRSALLQPADQDAALEKQWQDILTAKASGDVLVVRKSTKTIVGDEPKQLLALDYLEGILHNVTAETVQFDFDGSRVDVSRAKVEGVIYFHPVSRQLPEPLCSVTDTAGSQLRAKSVLLEDDQFKVTSTAGVEISLPLNRLRKLDFSGGKIVYLSDLVPDTVEWAPYVNSLATSAKLSRLYQPRFDRSFDGGKLMLGDRQKEYERGLAIHSRTLLMYRLPGEFQHFLATVGIDSRVRSGGHVQLVITGDGRRLFDGIITGKDPEPLELDLDVAGVRRLSILVDYGDELDIADHLNLCNARITK
jgi:hypothetical protein